MSPKAASDMRLDVIDQLLADLRHESCVFFRAELTEPYRILKQPKPNAAGAIAPFYAVLSGRARVEMSGENYDLCAGDFLVLPHGGTHEFCGANSEGAPAVDLYELCEQSGVPMWKPGVRYRKTVRFAYGGGGAKSVVLAGIFYFGDRRKSPLMESLPRVLVSRGGAASDKALLNTNLNAVREELEQERPGADMVVARLVDLLFMQAVRSFLAAETDGTIHANGGERAASWLRGVSDPVVGRAISAMHAAPDRGWTLESLAAEVGTSRAVFAARFSELVGQPAIAYLTAWRMHVAAGLLLEESDNIASVAGRVGYQSEAAFSIAFKRWAGTPPSYYRREMLRADRQA